MTDESKPKIENLDQKEEEELTREEAEGAQGGRITNVRSNVTGLSGGTASVSPPVQA